VPEVMAPRVRRPNREFILFYAPGNAQPMKKGPEGPFLWVSAAHFTVSNTAFAWAWHRGGS
jgi:hypothetical protein